MIQSDMICILVCCCRKVFIVLTSDCMLQVPPPSFLQLTLAVHWPTPGRSHRLLSPLVFWSEDERFLKLCLFCNIDSVVNFADWLLMGVQVGHWSVCYVVVMFGGANVSYHEVGVALVTPALSATIDLYFYSWLWSSNSIMVLTVEMFNMFKLTYILSVLIKP